MRVELERENLVRAGTIAQDVGAENLTPNRRQALRAIVQRAAEQADGRVIVVDAAGRLIGDSGPGDGDIYATPQRPEIVAALHDIPTSEIRFGKTWALTSWRRRCPSSTNRPRSYIRRGRGDHPFDGSGEYERSPGHLGVVAIGSGGLAAGLILAFALPGCSPDRSGDSPTSRTGSGRETCPSSGRGARPKEVEELASSFDQMADHVERTVQTQREFVANASCQPRPHSRG